jgi:hypothetical protein
VQSRRLRDRLVLYFPRGEDEAVELLTSACKRSVEVIRDTWGFPEPEHCRVYLMTSWLQFILHSAPWHLRVLWVCLLPLWGFRVRKTWRWAGGWTQRYRRRPAIGVKPPRLIEQADTSIGDLTFYKEPDSTRKMQHITCHEMTHAFSARLKLPMWLNEGIAMLAVDELFGMQTVRSDTLAALGLRSGRGRAAHYRRLGRMSKADIAYYYTRGYWITRFVRDRYPDLLGEALKQKSTCRALENRIARAFNLTRRQFWRTINDTVVSHFHGMLMKGGESPASET